MAHSGSLGLSLLYNGVQLPFEGAKGQWLEQDYPNHAPINAPPPSISESQASRNDNTTSNMLVPCQQVHTRYPSRLMALPSPVYRQEQSGSERISNLINTTQLICRDRSQVYSQRPDSELPFLEARAEEKRRPSGLYPPGIGPQGGTAAAGAPPTPDPPLGSGRRSQKQFYERQGKGPKDARCSR